MEINLQKAEIENSKNLMRLRILRPLDDDFMRCMFRAKGVEHLPPVSG
jgi:hypothetical protein